jgi:hypothetical protein
MKLTKIHFALAGVLLFAYLMHVTSAGLHGPLTPMAVVSLELVSSANGVQAIFDQWNVPFEGTTLLKKAIFNTYIDYGFLFFYGLLAFLVNKNEASKRNGTWKKILHISAWFSVIAACFDAIENALMLVSLHGTITDGIAQATVFFASCKFFLIFCSVVLGLGAALISLYSTYAKKS